MGSSLVPHFSQAGYPVRAFQRSAPEVKQAGVSYYEFDLSDVQDNGFEGANYIIHCAYRPVVGRLDREFGANTDIDGTKQIIFLARKYGISLVFLSTTSAHVGSVSYYAKSKLVAEKLFDLKRDLILRLGLVIGAGGVLWRIAGTLRKHRIIPLIGGGKQHIQTIDINDLCRVIEAGVIMGTVGKFEIADPRVVTMGELYRTIAENIAAKPVFIAVPLALVARLMQILEQFEFKLPFTSQNVLGLRDMKTYEAHSALEIFGVKTEHYRTTLSQVIFTNGTG